MDKPELQQNAGLFLFEWPDVKILVERLSENHQNITGELTIWSKSPGQDSLIEKSRINMLSEVARNRLAKSCADRMDSKDWVSLIKYAAIITIEEYRRGEPVVDLGARPETMSRKWRLQPILEEGQATTLYGPGSGGKSYLADYIAVLVQYGYAGLGRWIPQPGNVLFLDWETSQGEHQRRVWAIKQGLGEDDNTSGSIKYRYCTQPLASDIAEIQRLILEHDIELVIVDSQVAASGGDIERSDTANVYYNALRSLRCTTLTIDHVPKNTVAGGKVMPFGSVFKWNRARSIFELKSVQEPGSSSLEVGLYHRKCNEGRLLKPFGIRLDFTEHDDILECINFSPVDLADIPELIAGLSLKAQIESVLRSGALTVAEIAEELLTTDGNIRVQLNRHKDTFIKADPLGKTWGLVYKNQ